MTPARKRWLGWAAGLCTVAAAAVTALLLVRSADETSETLVVPEGRRASQVYTAADKALSLPVGSTEKAAEKAARNGTLVLPEQAHGNPEGHLFPATYPIDEDTTPTSLLTFMTETADKHIRQEHAATYRTLKIAALVQAEADTPEDMARVAAVIDNRLKAGMPLQMDSTINYAMGRSTLATSHADTELASPYNTYKHKGLPPTPINNPGADALRAAARPAKGDWLYFVTVAPGDTRFSADYARHRKHVAEFNANQQK